MGIKNYSCEWSTNGRRIKGHPEMGKVFLDRGLLFFHQLTEEAKDQAISAVVASEKSAHRRNLLAAKNAYRKNPNVAINDPYHIVRVFNNDEALRKINELGLDYVVPFIVQNFCMFNREGHLYSVMDDVCHSADYYNGLFNGGQDD